VDFCESGDRLGGHVERRSDRGTRRVRRLSMEGNAKGRFDLHIHGEQLGKVAESIEGFRRRLLRFLEFFHDRSNPLYRENAAGPEDHEPKVVMKDSVGWQFQFHASGDVFTRNDVALKSDLSLTRGGFSTVYIVAKNESNGGVGKGKRASKILVGTASWSDPGFVEHWYPKKMLAGERLAWYAQHFEMVEVNSSFYSVPDPRLTERWCHSTPDGFVFDVKLHQLLSRHSAKAKLLPPALQKRAETDAKGRVNLTPEIERAMIDEFRRPLEILRGHGKLGALLLQLLAGFDGGQAVVGW